MSKDVDLAWLAWARPIVRMAKDNLEHFDWCEKKLGSDRYTDLDPTLRWPGYVGGAWECGRGVLFIGSVHSDFRGRGNSESREPIVHALAKANAVWRGIESPSPADDLTYLEVTRHAYQSLIPHWPRAELFRDLMTRVFGDQYEPFSHAAWTNLAHCRSKPRTISEYPLQARCSGRRNCFPIGDLIKILCPAAIICPIKPMAGGHGQNFELVPPGLQPMPVIRFFAGAGQPKWHDKPANEWVPELAELIKQLRPDTK